MRRAHNRVYVSDPRRRRGRRLSYARGGKEELLSVKGNKESDPETLKAFFVFLFFWRGRAEETYGEGGGGGGKIKRGVGGWRKRKVKRIGRFLQ